MGINLVDLFVWSFLFAFAAKGFMKGFVREVCSLLGLVLGGWAAFRYASHVSELFKPVIQLPQHVSYGLSFLLILLLTGLLFHLLGHLVTMALKMALLDGANRIGGVIFAALQGALILCIVFYLAETRPWPKVKAKVEGSSSARGLAACGREIISGWEHRDAVLQAKGKMPEPHRK